MQLALSTNIFNHVEITRFPDLIPLFREAGFRYLEVLDRAEFDSNGSVLDDLRKKSEECGIKIPNWHLDMNPSLQKDKGINREAVESRKRSMEKGLRIGATNHVLHYEHRFLDRSYTALWREIVDEWVDHAKRLGICLLMETMSFNPKTNERGVPASEISTFVQNYSPEVLSVCIDVNHSNLLERLPDVVDKLKERLLSLHIADNDGYADRHWLPGQGVIDFSALLKSLKSIQFDGMFVLEVDKWCEQPESLSQLKKLYGFGTTLLETGRPHPDTPLL